MARLNSALAVVLFAIVCFQPVYGSLFTPAINAIAPIAASAIEAAIVALIPKVKLGKLTVTVDELEWKKPLGAKVTVRNITSIWLPMSTSQDLIAALSMSSENNNLSANIAVTGDYLEANIVKATVGGDISGDITADVSGEVDVTCTISGGENGEGFNIRGLNVLLEADENTEFDFKLNGEPQQMYADLSIESFALDLKTFSIQAGTQLLEDHSWSFIVLIALAVLTFGHVLAYVWIVWVLRDFSEMLSSTQQPAHKKESADMATVVCMSCDTANNWGSNFCRACGSNILYGGMGSQVASFTPIDVPPPPPSTGKGGMTDTRAAKNPFQRMG